MKKAVYRFLVKAHPNLNHKKYYPWNLAEICLLIGEDEKENALSKAVDKLQRENWIQISEMHKDILIEERVIALGGELLEQYYRAKQGENIFLVFTENWTGFKDSPPISIPKLTEAFMDKVILRAGGKRLDYISKKMKKNADYIIGDYIIELKILEEERLFKESVKTKLANLLGVPENKYVSLNHQDIPADKYNLYLNVFREPIQDAIKSASKQIKSTKEILNNDKLKGGIIFINNGTTSTPPEVFLECVSRSIKNNTSQIDTNITICNWLETNGSDSYFMYQIHPLEPVGIQKIISESFDNEMDAFMNDWGKSGFPQTEEMLEPLFNISYEKYGIVFTRYGSY
ncbi:hypothetical protein [Marinicrinis sediminis]|uniref:Uncharacterized protein n=1 Tax=Marinicrinis sediminis TaxID=1652465 RepID=A0ABW5R6X3_9BACL